MGRDGAGLYWVFHCIRLLIFENSLKVYFGKLVTGLGFFPFKLDNFFGKTQ